MDLLWTSKNVSVLNDAGITRNYQIDYGLDDTGRIYGEIRHDVPVFTAFHLRKVVGRYLENDKARAAIQSVHEIVAASKEQ